MTEYISKITIGDITYDVKDSTARGTDWSLVSWGSSSDEEIVAAIEALDNGDITTDDLMWEVGDERVVHLNAISAGTYNNTHPAQDATLVIMDVGAYNGTGNYVVGFKDILQGMEQMESTTTNMNGWNNSRGRKCCDALFNMIPSDLQPIFKTFTVYTAADGRYEGSGIAPVVSQNGKLSLFAEKEIVGNKVNSGTNEFNDTHIKQIKYYEVSANRQKKGNPPSVSAEDGRSYWWERSPAAAYYQGQTYHFCIITYAGGSSRLAADSTYYDGFSPFGVI